MEGVQILNQFEVVTDSIFSWNNFWVGAIVGAIIGFIVAIAIGLDDDSWLAFFIGLVIAVPVFGGFLGGFFGGIGLEPVAYETHYEVSINEEVNMQEFMDKYEILETRGAIYTVREK